MEDAEEPLLTLQDREDRFAAERERFGLRFRCDECAHVIPTSRRCSMGYPNAVLTGPVRGLQDDGTPNSCKYWELSESA